MNPDQINWWITHSINLLIPWIVGALGVTLLSVTPLGRAAISWLKGHINRGRAAELTGEVERLRTELMEVEERLDFAERRLARPATPAPFDAGRALPDDSPVVTPV